MNFIKNHFVKLLSYIALALFIRFYIIEQFIEHPQAVWIQVIAMLIVFGFGIAYIFRGTANTIEETTDVLKDRTKLAGGFLQALGTAFPDMIIGVMAAVLSLQVAATDHVRAINLAIIAAAATFGSNIYNIIHGMWCIHRQNIANTKQKGILMFPPFKWGGTVTPFSQHKTTPSVREMDGAIQVLSALTLLTSFVAISMVLFGRVSVGENPIGGDLYQLIRPVGFVLFVLCVGVLYYFRKSHKPETLDIEIEEEISYYSQQRTWRIWLDLILSGVAILLTAESMVKCMEIFSQLTHIPFVITGVMAGIIGCLGEMMVVHNFSINPKGRIGDGIVGVSMDNIVTTLGAAIVAIMGGIFLGSNSLILIFVIILTANTLLIGQISTLKNSLKK